MLPKIRIDGAALDGRPQTSGPDRRQARQARQAIREVARQVKDFYEANPGTLFRPRDICFVIGGKETDISAACEMLRTAGVLVAARNGSTRQRRYRLCRVG